jgi:uncharacterized protein (DUF697 family)
MANQFIQTITKSLRNLNPQDVRTLAMRPVTIGIGSTSDPGCSAILRFLGNTEGVFLVGAPQGPLKFDIEIYEEGVPCSRAGYTFHPERTGELVTRILADHDEISLPLARTFPGFRQAVSQNYIRSASKENATFSFVTALPDVMPNVAQLFWAFGEFASDTAFLTMNQLKMAFLLAAAHGREVGYREQKAEVASVIAGAFGWRTLARELVGKIPFGGGLIPKAAIAYAGTWVVGQSLDRLYTYGAAYNRGEQKNAYKEGLAMGQAVAKKLMSKFNRRSA